MYSPSTPILSIETPESSSSSLESSLLHLIDAHHHASLALRDQTEKSKKNASENALRISDLLVESVDAGVREAFANEMQIEAEIRALSASVARFGRLTERWLDSSRAVNNAVKEIGDFENWMKVMEFDCRSIAAAISNIHDGC